MPATATKKRKKVKAKVEENVEKKQQNFIEQQEKSALRVAEETIDVLDFLKGQCMEVSLEVGWFPVSKKINQSTLRAMVQAYEEKQQAQTGAEVTTSQHSCENIGAQKRLFSSKHPLVKAANAAKRELLAYRDSMTIPVAKVMPSDIDTANAWHFLCKDPGRRLIRKEALDEFDSRCQFLIGNLKAAVQELSDNMDQVKAFDSERIPAHLFDERDYPDAVTVDVRGPFPQEVNYTVDFEKLAPGMCNRVQKMLEQRLSGTVDLAVGDLAKGLVEFSETLAEQLSSRTRLYPPRTNVNYEELYEAEVVGTETHADSPDEVEEGYVRALVRRKVAKAAKGAKSVRNDPVWLMFTKEGYEALRPQTTSENKAVHDSSLTNLEQQCKSIHNVAQMLGTYGTPLATAVSKLEDMMHNISNNPSERANELRKSNVSRKMARASLLEMVASVQTDPNIVKVLQQSHQRMIVRGKKKANEEDD